MDVMMQLLLVPVSFLLCVCFILCSRECIGRKYFDRWCHRFTSCCLDFILLSSYEANVVNESANSFLLLSKARKWLANKHKSCAF